MRWAVPVFFMITGWLVLAPGKQVGAAKALRNVARFLVLLLAFALLRAVWEGGFSLGSILAGGRSFLAGESWKHMWYLYELVGIWLLMPVLSAFVRFADDACWMLVLGALFYATSIAPFVADVGFPLATLIPVGGQVQGVSLLYVLLGAYLRRRSLSRRARVLSAVLASACSLAGIWLCSPDGTAASHFLQPYSPFVTLWSLAVFSCLSSCGGLTRVPPVLVRLLSADSLFIYIFHAPLVPVVFALLAGNASTCEPWSLVLAWGVVLAASWLVAEFVRGSLQALWSHKQ